jgi:hypothetical protein
LFYKATVVDNSRAGVMTNHSMKNNVPSQSGMRSFVGRWWFIIAVVLLIVILALPLLRHWID